MAVYMLLWLLKCAAPIIAPHIKIINMSISTCSVPDRWKCAKVTPIFKGGEHTDRNCYRPISVLPVIKNYRKTYF